MQGKRPPHTLILFTLLLAMAGGVGCGGGMPRDRLGALPFPGLMTLYATADPEKLGPHRYEQWPRLFRADETERGIIYTARAGFLDLAHIRIAIDWTRFCTTRARAALTAGQSTLDLPGPDHAVFHVAFAYPSGWSALPEAERESLADAESRSIGQRIAYLMLTWHEVATWFGYRTLFFVDESPSAFTYDDSVSHLVGMRVAERAMREGGGFDAAVTASLQAELRRLGAVTPQQTDLAVRAVEGVWWSASKPLKRQAEVYLREDQVLYPWLVPGLPFCADASREAFALPRGVGGVGRDGSVATAIEIEPRIAEAGPMRDLLPGRPDRFRDDRDLPALLGVVRAQMREQYGPAVCQPWPDVATAGGAGGLPMPPGGRRPPPDKASPTAVAAKYRGG